ncbi:MAG TPA: class I SAM-dependent methyltransferase [Actinomycetota bacterium]|nr:class I SAM-dependent methyltransferase [Actinomycetota bacterium]
MGPRFQAPPRPTVSPLEHAFLAFQRNRLLQGIASVEDVSDQVEFGALRDLICQSGTDCLRHFGNGYLSEGGLALQQNPDEFAALCLFLERRGPFSTYLEIGSASGGTGYFLSREIGFDLAMSIDDGQHSRATEQRINLKGFTTFVGSSHSAGAATFLEETLGGLPLDLAFVDGDHTEEGVWKDIQLVLPFCLPGTLIVLHDTRACAGVEIAWLRASWERIITPLAEFVGDQAPLGIGVGRVN